MNKLVTRILTITLAALTAEPALAFEGILKLKLQQQGQAPQKILFYANRSGDLRLEIGSQASSATGGMIMILSKSKHATYILLAAQKQYIEGPAPDMKTAQTQATHLDIDRYRITKLGTAKVAGDMTTKIRVVDTRENTSVNVWLSRDLVFQDLASLWGQNHGGMVNQEMLALLKQKGIPAGFPLRMEGKDKQGRTVSMEVTTLQRKKLPPSLFLPPAGYKPAADPLSAMMGAVMGAMGNAPGASGQKPAPGKAKIGKHALPNR